MNTASSYDFYCDSVEKTQIITNGILSHEKTKKCYDRFVGHMKTNQVGPSISYNSKVKLGDSVVVLRIISLSFLLMKRVDEGATRGSNPSPSVIIKAQDLRRNPRSKRDL